MERKVLTVLFTALFAFASGQTLVVSPTLEEPDMPQFNAAFIARNGIQAIKGTRMVKRDGQPMRDESEQHYFRFDAQGRTAYSNHSQGKPGSGRDTTSQTWSYDAQGLPTQRLHSDAGGDFAYVWEHDSIGRVVRETYRRIARTVDSAARVVPGTAFEISDERFVYVTVNDSTWRKRYSNYLGLPYREQTFTYDHRGYLLRVEDRYLITERRSRITFTYNDRGQLATRVEQPDLSLPGLTRHTWLFDSVGNVVAGELWRNDRQVHREEFLYDANTMVLTARIRKDISTGNIHVIKYTTIR
jgi:hypothetical protein